MHHSPRAREGLKRRGFQFLSSFAAATPKVTAATLATLFVAAVCLSACGGSGSASGGGASASLVSLCLSHDLSGNGNPDESQGQRTSVCQCEVSYMLNHGVSASQAAADMTTPSASGEEAYGAAVASCVLGTTGTTTPNSTQTTVPTSSPTTVPTSSPTTVPTTTPTTAPSSATTTATTAIP